MPADATRRAGLRRWLSAHLQPFEQSHGRLLPIGKDRKTPAARYVFRRDINGAAELPDPVGSSVDVVNFDKSDPERYRASGSRAGRQFEKAANALLPGGEKAVRAARHQCVGGAPAHDIGVEHLGGFDVRRHQLVPDKTAWSVGHILLRSECGDGYPMAQSIDRWPAPS